MVRSVWVEDDGFSAFAVAPRDQVTKSGIGRSP
jgi:hypothetical protein